MRPAIPTIQATVCPGHHDPFDLEPALPADVSACIFFLPAAASPWLGPLGYYPTRDASTRRLLREKTADAFSARTYKEVMGHAHGANAPSVLCAFGDFARCFRIARRGWLRWLCAPDFVAFNLSFAGA